MAVTKTEVTTSLKAAADAAHSAFLAAAAIDPAAAKPLWVDSITTSNAYLTALQQDLSGDDAAIQAAQTALDQQTKALNTALQDLKDVVTAISAVGTLVSLVTTFAKFLA